MRDIAEEAGVNVALINRYFTSKEGLFKACLTGAADERLLLRAQIALSAALGIALLRSTAAMEPLSSAGEQELVEPLREMINALLG